MRMFFKFIFLYHEAPPPTRAAPTTLGEIFCQLNEKKDQKSATVSNRKKERYQKNSKRPMFFSLFSESKKERLNDY